MSLGRNSAVMASGTVLSRITGMVRDVMMVAAIGTAVFADTYSVANTIPNIIYILMIGGALNAVFVPQLVRRMATDSDGGTAYINRLLSLVFVGLLGITALAMLLAPWLVRIYGSTQWSDQAFSVSTLFALYCLPQILFYGIYTMLSQVLNARDVFASPMFAPIANNLVVIIVTVIWLTVVGVGRDITNVTSGEIALLGVGTTLGVAIQALVMVPSLRKIGIHWRLSFDWRGYGLGHAFNLAKWTVLLVLVNQVAYAVITQLATTANVNAEQLGQTATGFTSYLRAHLLFILPHSVITVSIVTALLPRMSRSAHEGRMSDVADDVMTGIRNVSVLLIPSAAFFIALGPSIGRLLYGHGASDLASGTAIGVVLAMFALGLPAYSIYYVLLRGFYALEDTKTPFYLAIVLNSINIVAALLLFNVLSTDQAVPGLALAYSLAYVLTTLASWVVLSRRLNGLSFSKVALTLIKMACAAALSASIVGIAAAAITQRTFVTELIVIAVSGVVFFVLFALIGSFLRINEISTAKDMVLRRLR